MIIYNKLVRDEIPTIIKAAGKKCEITFLDNKTYSLELKKKLIEESKELSNAITKSEVIEELADVYEVLESILIDQKIDINDIKEKRILKNIKKGAYENKVFLKSVD